MIKPMKPKHHRAAETQRTHFRVFRDFRGSSFSVTILLSFALLLADAPAPAQSPAILLDIKSPATVSPPNESLLTLNDQGDLWIKGHLYDYAFQSTITLDPNRDYWTIRDASGNVVWALEAYNRTSGVSTGDLYSIGSFEGWAAEPDQTDAILRYTNASSQVVFTLSAAGEARAAATAPQRDTPAPWGDAPALGDIPASSSDPSTVSLTAEASGKNVGDIVPVPQARGRIFFSVAPTWPVGLERDVTGIEWRQRWWPGWTSLRENYGVCLGCRYRKCFNQTDWQYYGADTNGVFGEIDAAVVSVAGQLAIRWWPEAEAGVPDTTWDPSYSPPTPPASTPPPAPLTFGASWSDYQRSDWGHTGNSVDDYTVAYTRLFLYWMQFDEDRKASAVPRRDGDRWMNVRCCLQPRPMPPGWINRIELTIWDPAHVDTIGNGLRRRKIVGAPGQDCISVMWDGKLYDNESGQPDPYFPELTPYYYTEASDVFMKATVCWNLSTPQKLWENSGECTFQEQRVAIVVWGIWPGGTLEVGQPYSFQTATNALPVAIASYLWDFEGKAFQNVDHDVYNSNDLLTTAQKTTANVTTKFITGWKTSVTNTDLGPRTVQLTVTDTSGTLWTSTLRPYLMVHRSDSVRAKITFYHLAYEAQDVFTTGPLETAISMFDPVSQTARQYYFGDDFLSQIRVQGTGVPHKLRTESGLSKEEGSDPAPQQRYIMYAPGNPGTYSFSATCRVSNQDGAHFYWDGGNHQHRSYFNRDRAYEVTDVFCPATGAPYYYPQVTFSGLAGLVNARRGAFTGGDIPMLFTSSQATIRDAGTFDTWENRDIDEKHIDVFLEATGSQGINRQEIFDRLGTVWATVRRP